MECESCIYPVYTHLWFWMIAIGALFLAIGLVLWDVLLNMNQPWWIWGLIILGGILLLLGIFLAIWKWWAADRTTEYQVMTEEIPIPQPLRPVC